MPVDVIKTTLQVNGKDGMNVLKQNINHNITELRGMLNNVNYHNNRIKKLIICLKSMTGLSILFFMSSLYLIIECDGN